MDGVPGQIGTVLVGILLLLSTSLLAPEQIFWLGLVAAAVCVVIVVAIRRRYADALLRTLRSGIGEQILEGGPGLGDLLAAPDVRAALIAALHAPDAGTREMAAVLLARSPEIDARQALAAALDDDAPAVRAAAAVAILGVNGGQGEGLEPDRAESCLGSLATGDVAARAASLDALRRLRRPLTDAQLAACVADPSPDVRAAAMSALENTTTPNAADALVAGLSDPAARVRVAAASTLAARPEIDPRVVDLLGTTDASTEAAAITALAGHGEQARDRILAWADDEVTHALALSGARVDLRSGAPPDTPDFALLCSVLDHRVLHAESMALGAMTALGAPATGRLDRPVDRGRPVGPAPRCLDGADAAAR